MIIELDPGDIPTWLGAIGTIAAFLVAFMQIRTERHHRRRFAMHEWLANRRDHADRVTAWVAGDTLVIANESGHLVHAVAIELDSGQRLDLDHVEPGRTTRDFDDGGVTRPVASLTFTDARGNRWVRRGSEHPELVSGPDAQHADERRAQLR